MIDCQLDIYTYEYIRGIGTVILTVTTRTEHPSPGNDASTAEAASGRVGRDEQGEAQGANTTRYTWYVI